ncbi:MAG: prolyl oligopeptidase family serine peptidase [Alphaproteobacteria bacterium]
MTKITPNRKPALAKPRAKPRAKPPRAKPRAHKITTHGHTRNDPWAWIRAENWDQVLEDPTQLNTEIRELLEAENQYCESVLKPAAKARKAIKSYLKSRIAAEEESVRLPRSPWIYWTRWRKDAQYQQHWRGQGNHPNSEMLLLDEAALAKGHNYFRLLGLEVSPDQNQIAFVCDTQGNETGTLIIRNLMPFPKSSATPPTTPPTAPPAGNEIHASPCNGDFVWNAEGDGLYYIRLDAHHRPGELWFHSLKNKNREDVLVHREADGGFFLSLESHSNTQALLLHAHDHNVSEIHQLSNTSTPAKINLLLARSEGARAQIAYDAKRKRFLILRSAPECLDYQLEAISETPGKIPQTRKVIIPHKKGRMLKQITLTEDLALIALNSNGQPGLLLLELETQNITPLPTPETIGALNLITSLEYQQNILYFAFSSPRTPPSIFAIKDGKESMLWQKPVPKHKPNAYIVEALTFPSADGTQVPCTLLRRNNNDTPQSPRPTLLYGYGAYGIDEPGYFSIARLALVDAGVQFAAARPRGGSDLGREWHETGKLQHKENTFLDCIAIADGLIQSKRTTPQQLALLGGSAGGMMVGAVLNSAPERFRAAIAAVPFVDVLNTMLDDTLPLTPPEWQEWGNPITNPNAFKQMRDYSPYENVANLNYPWILATAGISDPRVGYWEPAKWIQRLRERATNARGPILLQTHMGAGHGGASGRYDRLDEIAREWAFILLALGLLNNQK